MPPVVIPNAVQVTLTWSFGGLLFAQNVHRYIDIAAQTINQTIADLVEDVYKDELTASGLLPALATTCALVTVGIRDVSEANLPEFVGAGVPLPGTDATDMLPPSICLVATLRTAMAGRRFRGRHYQPGFAEAENGTNGLASTAAINGLVSWLGGVKASMGSAGFLLGVASTGARDALGVLIPPIITPVTTVEVRDPQWDVQRRRATPGI